MIKISYRELFRFAVLFLIAFQFASGHMPLSDLYLSVNSDLWGRFGFYAIVFLLPDIATFVLSWVVLRVRLALKRAI